MYHFQIVTYLAWMSSSVHLSALTILGPFLLHHRGVLAWRLVGMLTLLIMLLIALVPTVSNLWAILSPLEDDWTPSPKTSMGASALCFWGTTYGDGVNPDSVLSFLVLAVSYIWRISGLFSPATSAFAAWIRDPFDSLIERLLTAIALKIESKARRRDIWAFRICLAVYLPATAVFETLGSFSSALWLSLLGLVFGMLQILTPRSLVQSLDEELAERERLLTFGQLVPLILLIQPLGALTENIWLVEEEHERVYNHGGDAKYNFSHARSDTPFLRFMTTYIVPRTEEATQRRHLKSLLYGSRLFHLLLWMIQVAIAAAAITVFIQDYYTIGFTTAGSWQYISIVIGAYLFASPLSVVVLAPFSCLGRSSKRHREVNLLEQRQGTIQLNEVVK